VSPTREEATVAWLHDVVEDTPTTLTEVEVTFGSQVAAAVDAITHRSGEPSLDYYARVKSNPLALTVKAADLADNTDPSRLELLPPDVRARLEAKYAVARRELGIG
jgi:(p)ppGpp synthase/HD superfamily hydrolase